MTSLRGYTVLVPIEVRFRDTDAFGHVNNAVYLSYFELGRMRYWARLTGLRDPDPVPFVLVRAEVDFQAAAHHRDRLTLGIRLSRLGNKSFDFDYLLRREGDGVRVATGKTVQVTFDHSSGSTVSIPDDLRHAIESLEQNLP